MTIEQIEQIKARAISAKKVLPLVQRHACSYIGSRCDCKYGVTRETLFRFTENGNGCPELRDAIACVSIDVPVLLEALEISRVKIIELQNIDFKPLEASIERLSSQKAAFEDATEESKRFINQIAYDKELAGQDAKHLLEFSCKLDAICHANH